MMVIYVYVCFQKFYLIIEFIEVTENFRGQIPRPQLAFFLSIWKKDINFPD